MGGLECSRLPPSLHGADYRHIVATDCRNKSQFVGCEMNPFVSSNVNSHVQMMLSKRFDRCIEASPNGLIMPRHRRNRKIYNVVVCWNRLWLGTTKGFSACRQTFMMLAVSRESNRSGVEPQYGLDNILKFGRHLNFPPYQQKSRPR